MLYNKTEVLRVPERLDGSDLLKFLNSMLNCDETNISLDFSNLGFAVPNAVVSLTNIIVSWQKEGRKIGFSYKDYSPPINYLDDCLFFEKLFGQKLNKYASPRNTTNGLEILPIDTIPYSYITRSINWLKYSLGFSSKSFSELETSLVEVLNNIRDHSGAKSGSCFAQHYPKINCIKLAIADFGVGIPNKIREKFPEIESDSLAIEYASRLNVSSMSKPNNSGNGIPTIIGLLQTNGGSLTIESLKGRLFIDGSIKNYKNSYYKYPGTLIHMVFRTDTLEEDVEEEFIWS